MPVPTPLRCVLLLLCSLLLGACGGLGPGAEAPQVSITSFNLAPDSTGSSPRFLIGLRVVNPNRTALRLRGMSYTVEIDGNRILNGARPDLPTVMAYDSADFTLEARPDLLGSARLLADLFTRQRTALGYTFRARLDAGGLFSTINVEESGNFGLPGSSPR